MKLLISLLAFATLLIAENLSGIWVGQIPARNGDLLDIAFQLTQTGTILSGKMYGDYGSSPIVEGKVTGDEIVFVVRSTEQAGNQINTSRLRFSGTLKNGELELSRERESSTNAGNGGGVESRGSTKQAFHLKRLF